ncbi:hypothetical protein [Granulicella sibirica]|nr:hypothetical protein [Granulicella sibirica]
MYVLTFTVLTTVEYAQHGLPLDDSYIHQTVARNLADRGILGFSQLHRSSGATSLLWTLIQATNYLLFRIDPVWYNLGISYVLLALIGPLLFVMASRDRLPPFVSWVVAISPALLGNFVWLGMIGMEHLLFAVFSLSAIYFWLLPPDNSLRSAVFTGCCAGLLVLTRPESIPFAPLLFLFGWAVAHQRRRLREYLVVLAFWIVCTCIQFGANLYTSKTLMPATLKGRSWLYFHNTGGPHSIRSMARFCGAWVQRLPRQFSTSYTHQLNSLREAATFYAFLGIILLVLTIVGVLFLLQRKPLRIGALVLWSGIHFSIYLFTFPTGGHGGRYQPLTLMLFFPLLVLGVYQLLSLLARGDRPWVKVAVVVFMCFASLASLGTWRRVTFAGIAHINNTHGKIATWMRANVPTTDRFAAFDIGRVSYDWGGDVIDLGGLVDPTYVDYLQTGRVIEYLKLKQVQYVLLPSTGSDDLTINPSTLGGEKVAEYCSDPGDWLLGFRYTIHATQCQTLYRVTKW